LARDDAFWRHQPGVSPAGPIGKRPAGSSPPHIGCGYAALLGGPSFFVACQLTEERRRQKTIVCAAAQFFLLRVRARVRHIGNG
jgi:hypothetical protein